MPLPSFDIRRATRSGFSVTPTSSNPTSCYIACHEKPGLSAVTVHEGDSSRHPYIAQADFPARSKDFRIFVGSSKEVADQDWDNIRYSEEKKGFLVFKKTIESYRFDCREPTAEPGKTAKRRLVWTEESGGFLLRDDATDVVLAAYADKSTLGGVGIGSKLGQLQWREECSRTVELAALVTVMAVAEKRRRKAGAVNRAVGGGGAGNGGTAM